MKVFINGKLVFEQQDNEDLLIQSDTDILRNSSSSKTPWFAKIFSCFFNNQPSSNNNIVSNNNSNIVINGEKRNEISSAKIEIKVEGPTKTLTTQAGDVFIQGDVEKIESSCGNVHVNGNATNIVSASGNIKVLGSCSGNISSSTGNIRVSNN